MISSLAPVLVNIILKEFEKNNTKPCRKSGTLKLCCRYVNNTLVLVKIDRIDVLQKFMVYGRRIRK